MHTCVSGKSCGPEQLARKPADTLFFFHTPGYQYCTWKRRFLRLERASLAYYKREDSAAPKGVIQLSAYSLCKVGERAGISKWQCQAPRE